LDGMTLVPVEVEKNTSSVMACNRLVPMEQEPTSDQLIFISSIAF
jgi:hypothetical protein